jgi:hypothetical protein
MAPRSQFICDSDRLPKRKPMVPARRVSLFQRDVQVSLSSAAIDILFKKASVLSEGQVEKSGYFGSTMITFDCSRAADLISDACNPATVKRVCDLLGADERVRHRARRLGETEAERLAGSKLSRAHVDMRVRASGNHLHIDLDVEGTTR